MHISGSAAERAQLEPWLRQLPAGVDDQVGRQTLPELMAFIRRADALVASGTGPLHLAGACGVRAVGIFAPLAHIGSGRWRPIGPDVVTLESARDGPCRRSCSNLDCACLAAVSPRDVLAALLDRRPAPGGSPRPPSG